MTRTPNQLRTPPPLLGEHNREIYIDMLGYTEQELSELEDKGLVGTRYPDHLLPAHVRETAAQDTADMED